MPRGVIWAIHNGLSPAMHFTLMKHFAHAAPFCQRSHIGDRKTRIATRPGHANTPFFYSGDSECVHSVDMDPIEAHLLAVINFLLEQLDPILEERASAIGRYHNKYR